MSGNLEARIRAVIKQSDIHLASCRWCRRGLACSHGTDLTERVRRISTALSVARGEMVA